jgi:hypothetical protein
LRLVRRRVPVLRSEEMNEVVVHFTCKLLNSDNAILIGFPGKPLERLSCPLTLNQRVPGPSPGAPTKNTNKFMTIQRAEPPTFSVCELPG